MDMIAYKKLKEKVEDRQSLYLGYPPGTLAHERIMELLEQIQLRDEQIAQMEDRMSVLQVACEDW